MEMELGKELIMIHILGDGLNLSQTDMVLEFGKIQINIKDNGNKD